MSMRPASGVGAGFVAFVGLVLVTSCRSEPEAGPGPAEVVSSAVGPDVVSRAVLVSDTAVRNSGCVTVRWPADAFRTFQTSPEQEYCFDERDTTDPWFSSVVAGFRYGVGNVEVVVVHADATLQVEQPDLVMNRLAPNLVLIEGPESALRTEGAWTIRIGATNLACELDSEPLPDVSCAPLQVT